MSASQTDTPSGRGLTFRAILIAIVLAWLGTVWMKIDGIVSHTIQLGESVPCVPAVAGLCLFLVLNPVLARIRPRWALTRPEMVVIFVVLSITPTINSVGMMRMLLPSTNVAYYFDTPETNLDKVWEDVPDWYGPRDPETIRQMYEGSDEQLPPLKGSAVVKLLTWAERSIAGLVPWRAWLGPMFVWGSFALAFFICLLSFNVLIRKQWSERERLAFPLVQFIEPLTPSNSPHVAPILRNPLFWVGCGLSFVFNLLNMLHALSPSVPAPGPNFNLGALFTERPWSAIQPLIIQWRPEVFGLGFLMSTEILLSCWLFYILVRFSKVVATIQGSADRIPGFPFDRELCNGGYLALTGFVLWVARKHLWAAAQCALGRGPQDFDEGEPVRYRWAFVGFFGGFFFMVIFAVIAGMSLWLALLYFSLIVGVAITYTRIRAETGAPMVWFFPYWEHQHLLDNLFGTARLAPNGDFRSLTIMHGFAWLSRGYYTTSSASQIEALKLADEADASRRQILIALILACILGLGLAYWAHLSAYYEYGGNVLEGGSTEGGYRIRLMTQSYTEVATWMDTPGAPDGRRNLATLVGFLITLALIVLRMRFLRFPLHPLGFSMTLAHTGMWGAALLVWIIKTAVLRVGGVRLYKQLVPLFIGIVLGHFFTAGVVWGMVAVFNEELAEKYGVWFG